MNVVCSKSFSERLGTGEADQKTGPRPDATKYSRHTDRDVTFAFCGRKGYAQKTAETERTRRSHHVVIMEKTATISSAILV